MNWLSIRLAKVKTIGLLEAKTKLSELCESVATKGEAVVVTRHGKPLVRIEPIRSLKPKPKDVWERRANYIKRHGPPTEDFALPPQEKQAWRTPLKKT